MGKPRMDSAADLTSPSNRADWADQWDNGVVLMKWVAHDTKGHPEEEEGGLGILKLTKPAHGGGKAGKEPPLNKPGGSRRRTERDPQHTNLPGRDKRHPRRGRNKTNEATTTRTWRG